MEPTLIVINPNSSQSVTDGIDSAVEPLRRFGVPIRCLTLAEGPPGIENQRQADLTTAPHAPPRRRPRRCGGLCGCLLW